MFSLAWVLRLPFALLGSSRVDSIKVQFPSQGKLADTHRRNAKFFSDGNVGFAGAMLFVNQFVPFKVFWIFHCRQADLTKYFTLQTLKHGLFAPPIAVLAQRDRSP